MFFPVTLLGVCSPFAIRQLLRSPHNSGVVSGTVYAFDPNIRAEMLKRKSGLIARVETVYNDIFVSKQASLLKMASQWKGWQFPESEANLADPDDLPILYTRAMSIATIYPQHIKRVLVLGLGGGSIPVYLTTSSPTRRSTRLSSIRV